MASPSTTHPLLGDEPLDDEPPELRVPSPSSGQRRDVDWRQPLGAVALGFALLSFCVGWFQIANTDQEWEQLPYLASAGGLGVVALATAIALFVSVEHTRDREAIGELVREIRGLKRKIEQMESAGRETP